MGGGIAMTFLFAGLPVTLVEREQAALDRGVGVIRKTYEATARKGRLTGEQVDAALELLTPALSLDTLADCDLVIEAVFETMEAKVEVLRGLDAVVRPGAILASNTSYLDLDRIAAATERPESVIGLHFFSPANVMRFWRSCGGAKTAPDVLATCMAPGQAARQGRGRRRRLPRLHRQQDAGRPSQGGRSAGPAGGRPTSGSTRRCWISASPWGRSRSPTSPAWTSAGAVRPRRGERSARCSARAAATARRPGRGFYDYDEARNRTPSQEVRSLIAELAETQGVAQREIGQDEILERLLYPMVNEGAHILSEGIAQRAGDIDVVWINGYGWPAWTGGPMFWASERGLSKVVDGLRRRQPDLEPGSQLSPLLLDRAASGKGFN